MQEDLHMAPDFRSCSACGELHDTYDSKRDHYLLPVRDAQGNETTIGTAPAWKKAVAIVVVPDFCWPSR